MTVRVLVLLGAATAAVACGGDDASTTSAGPPSVHLELDVAEPPVPEAPVTWQVTIVNETEGPVVFTCPSSQVADVVLRNQSGVVYRWSERQVFTQVISTVEVEPGRETVSLEEPSLDVAAGRYEAEASLTCEQAPPPVRIQVEVG